MLKLEEIQKNAALNGIEPGHVVRVATPISRVLRMLSAESRAI